MIENPFKTWFKARKAFKFPKVYWFHYKVCKLFWFYCHDVFWEAKYDNFPDIVLKPKIAITLLNNQFIIEFGSSDSYWEELLWYLYYSDSNLSKARETWPWVDHNTKKSTWTDKYLVQSVDN